MRRPAALILIVSLLYIPFATPGCGGQHVDAKAVYDRGNYEEAYRLLEPLARQGIPDAQTILGIMYSQGQGVPQDYAEGAKWFRKAAEQGDAKAQTNLGIVYYEGQGVQKDYAKAEKWFRKAAEQGHDKAQYKLGYMYYEGQGIPQDYTEAIKWFQASAEQGNPDSQYQLGFIYAYGNGAPVDSLQAYIWSSLACTYFIQDEANRPRPTNVPPRPPHPACSVRDFAASVLSPERLAEAQRLAREWKPKKEGK